VALEGGRNGFGRRPIHAEATVKAACISAAADLVGAGKVNAPSGQGADRVARVAMDTWNHLVKPAKWPS
jgi:hypothetical protein